MSDAVSLRFDGLEQMMAELRTLPTVMQKRVMLGAVATGASVIRKEAIVRAPLYVEFDLGTGVYRPIGKGHPPPGTLKKAIYQTRLQEECTPTMEVWKIGVRQGKAAQAAKGGSRDAYYASWVENGHYTRAPKSAGSTRKARRNAVATGSSMVTGAHWVVAHPFMRPAVDTKSQEAFEAMQSYIRDNIGAATLAMKYLQAQGRL